MIDVQNLTFAYAGSGSPALHDVSFRITEGEMCAFLAPNGGGKTTLFKILSTMLPVQGGTVRYHATDYRNEYRAIRNRIGVVFQSPSVDKKLTVRENLDCQAFLYGLSPREIKDHIDHLVRLFGIGTSQNVLVGKLSGGFQRRVELAKCMLHKPSILLLDEPSTGLDIVSRKELWDYLKRIREQEKVSVLVTTHLAEEGELCDRVIIMNEGEIIADGYPDTLKNRVGGDVLSVHSSSPGELQQIMKKEWNLEAVLIDGVVRVELRDRERVLQSLLQNHVGLIRSITLSKPSLADVFFKFTGNPLFENQPDEKVS
jgi:ABC-2 type transport system ATP-binding protein